MAIGEQSRRRLIRRPPAGDHIARDCPWRAAEADQRGLLRQRPLDAGRAPRTPARAGASQARAKLLEALRVADRVEARTVAAFEGDALAERVGKDENVGEQDRRVEAEPADRLQRRLDRERGVIAEIEKRRGPGAKLAIFGQIAARLAHEPDRRRFLSLARKRGEEGLGGTYLRRRNLSYSAARFISG